MFNGTKGGGLRTPRTRAEEFSAPNKFEDRPNVDPMTMQPYTRSTHFVGLPPNAGFGIGAGPSAKTPFVLK